MKYFWGFAAVLFLAHACWGFTADVTGAVVTLAYEEPATNADGSPLTDLSHTTVYYDIGDGPVQGVSVPASAPSGGGAIKTQVTVPIHAGTEAMVDFWATASDISGNESGDSNHVQQRIDLLPPSPPQ